MKNNSQTYKVILDRGKSLKEMIKSYGDGKRVSEEINDYHFPVHGYGQLEVELVLVHLNRKVTRNEVCEYLNKKGLMPASIVSLFALGATYPELQRQFPIVALGSVWVMNSDNRYSPILLSDKHGQGFIAIKWVSDRHICFDATCRFLAIRKDNKSKDA